MLAIPGRNSVNIRFLVAACFVLVLPSWSFAADPIVVPKPVPFADDDAIAGNIKRECQLGEHLADHIAEFANAQNIATTFAADAKPDAGGQVLEVQIKDAGSSGNAFLGHRKSTLVVGKLYRNGEVVGSFRDRRDSMGGAFGDFKGSCSVLGRTVKAIGQDIAEWLVTPTMKADLGDLK